MSKAVSKKIDIDNGNIDNWILEYFGEQKVLLFVLRDVYKNKRKSFLERMNESDSFRGIKEKLKIDSRGNVTILFSSEQEKTFALLK